MLTVKDVTVNRGKNIDEGFPYAVPSGMVSEKCDLP